MHFFLLIETITESGISGIINGVGVEKWSHRRIYRIISIKSVIFFIKTIIIHSYTVEAFVEAIINFNYGAR